MAPAVVGGRPTGCGRPVYGRPSAAEQGGHLTAVYEGEKAVAAATAFQRRFAQVLRGVKQRLHLVYGRTQFFRPSFGPVPRAVPQTRDCAGHRAQE